MTKNRNEMVEEKWTPGSPAQTRSSTRFPPVRDQDYELDQATLSPWKMTRGISQCRSTSFDMVWLSHIARSGCVESSAVRPIKVPFYSLKCSV
ncbi:hypothetical protein BDV32DRAFT_124513 [Aspergillus pseudonomiae]|nr:hypothetical protein BDV32DRAFT_124513 [Aspergillus pseudonomiae]